MEVQRAAAARRRGGAAVAQAGALRLRFSFSVNDDFCKSSHPTFSVQIFKFWSQKQEIQATL